MLRKDAAIRLAGGRSREALRKDQLRRYADKARKRYTAWCDAGHPPPSQCRRQGEMEDGRPFVNAEQYDAVFRVAEKVQTELPTDADADVNLLSHCVG